jgi:hypothetical protein
MNILRTRSGGKLSTSGLGRLQQLQSLRDDRIARVEFARPGISIDGIGYLVVATLVKASEIEPNFGNVRVDSYGTGVGIKSIAKLVDLEVENSYRAPEGWIASVAVDGLLIGFVCLVVLLTCHISAAEKVPALGIRWIWK